MFVWVIPDVCYGLRPCVTTQYSLLHPGDIQEGVCVDLLKTASSRDQNLRVYLLKKLRTTT